MRYRQRSTTRRIIVHEVQRPEDHPGGIISYLRFRGRQKGLLDIGYHFVVDTEGYVEATRSSGSVGSHTPTANHDSIAIAVEVPATSATMEGLGYAVAAARAQFGWLKVWHRNEVVRLKDPPPVTIDVTRYNSEEAYEMTTATPAPEAPQKPEGLGTHAKLILDYLQTGRRLTNAIALVHLGIGSITSRVAELRAEGHEIKDAWKTDFHGGRYKEYFMGKGDGDVE